MNFLGRVGRTSLTGLLAVNLSLLILPFSFSPMSEINERRETAGCGPLRQSSDRYRRDALYWSRHMADLGEIVHSHLQLDHFERVGEVVGVGETTRRIVRALFRSDPHRSILLDCRYDLIAVGVYRAERVWLTARLFDVV